MYELFGVMVKIVSGVRLASMLLFVLVSSISLSTFADAGDTQANDAASSPSVGNLFYNGSLTEKQKKSIVTIEFNCAIIDRMNRTVVDSIYENVHREILKSLNRRKSTITTTSTPMTSLFATTLISTTPTPTTISTTVGLPPPSKKKKRKKREGSSEEYDVEDLRLVGNDPEIDENGVLRVSLLLDGKEMDNRDYGMILYHAANQTKEDGTLDRKTGVAVVRIYRRLPESRGTMSSQINYNFIVWPLVILFVILLFIGIGGFVYYWEKHKTVNWWPWRKEKRSQAMTKMPHSQDL